MTRIWKVYKNGIYYYISKILFGDRSRCDDCFQETMLKVYRGLEGYSAGRPMKPWIYRIAHNCCQDYRRTRNEEILDGTAAMSIADSGDQEDDLIRDELMRAIDSSIRRLDAENAQIAYLRFFEGMKFRVIARIFSSDMMLGALFNAAIAIVLVFGLFHYREESVLAGVLSRHARELSLDRYLDSRVNALSEQVKIIRSSY